MDAAVGRPVRHNFPAGAAGGMAKRSAAMFLQVV